MAQTFQTKEDICAHLGDEYSRFMGAVTPPIFQNSLFVRKHFDECGNPGYGYSRISNPTTDIVEEKLAALEEGEGALLCAAGMAAISNALLSCLSAGDHVVTIRRVYGGVHHLLDNIMPRFGVSVTYVNSGTPEEFDAATQPNTKVYYLESPSTGTFELQDIPAVVAVAKARKVTTIIDNTWATPMFQNPIAMGVDLVCHSASKYLGGHSDLVAGVVVGSKERIESMRGNERGTFGNQLEPFGSWLLMRGLRSLPIRMKQHQENALKVAAFLENHPKIERVMYPGLPSFPQHELAKKQMRGFSSLMGFVVKGDTDDIWRFMDSLHYFQQGPSWGGYESLIVSFGVGTTAEDSAKSGIPVNTVRIHVGLEHADTLIADLDAGLKLV